MSMDAETQDKIAKYLARSRQAVETGKLVLAQLPEPNRKSFARGGI